MSSMGMDKSATFAMASNTTAQVAGAWTARSGYPATVITSAALVADAAAPVIIQCKVTLTSAWGFGTAVQFRVLKNGVQIGTTASIPFNSTTVTFTNISTTLAVGDQISLSYTTAFGASGTIQTGATNTYLFYDQQATTYNVDGTRTDNWGISGTIASQLAANGAVTENWGRTGSLSVNLQANGTRTNNWGISGTIYKGAFLDVAGARPINWGISGTILLVPKPTPLPSVFDVVDVSMSIHTVDGRHVGDFPCRVVNSFNWTREASEVSICSFEVATQGDPDLVEDLLPWVHWVTVWHDGTEVWTGPIQSVKITSAATTISARDTATLMWRTRVPVSRTWVDTHTEEIAFDLWKAMLQLHRVKVTPVVLTEVVQRSFTITAKAEQRMLNQLMDDLTKVGLVWTVVAGRPVFGRFSRDPVVTLEECDFMVELERRRDGTQTFNDVRIQGQNWAQNAKAELAGLNLQTVVSMDDMFGAANIQRAALQYAHDSARIRDELVVPSSASLHHEAPVSLDDLVPGKVFTVHSGTISQLMRLDQVAVSGSASGIDVQVGLVALEAQDEIARLVGGGAA